MKNNIVVKIKISIFLFIISLIYFSFFDFLYGRLGFSFFLFWTPLFTSLLLVFVYPYIKIDSQSLFKRGLFFGIMVWIIDLPQILMDVRQMMLNIPEITSFIKDLLYFIILGLILSFCYKKFLSEEFNLPFKALRTSFLKIILAVVLAALVYFLFMYFAELLILYKATHESISGYISSLLNPWLYINPLIYGLIFAVLYTKTIRKVDISSIKKWASFSLFIFFFTTPLILPLGGVARSFFDTFFLAQKLLLIPHLLSIFIIGYIFTSLLDKRKFVLLASTIVILIAVSAGGVLAWQYLGAPKEEFKAPEEVAEDETANWKVYRNQKYGFEFKYPKDWAAIESVSPGYPYLVFVTLGLQETIQQGGLFGVAIRDQTEDEYFSSLAQEGFYIISRTDTTLGDKKATIYILSRTGSPGIQWKEVITQKDDFLLQFSRGATLGYEDIFNQMLSTFSFITEEKESLTILFPKGGEQLVRGQTYEIRWKTEGVNTVDIELLNSTTRAYSKKITTNYPNTGAYSWTIPLDPQGILPIFDYVLDISESGGLGISDRSKTFSIIRE